MEGPQEKDWNGRFTKKFKLEAIWEKMKPD